jgi:hypothetical protein
MKKVGIFVNDFLVNYFKIKEKKLSLNVMNKNNLNNGQKKIKNKKNNTSIEEIKKHDLKKIEQLKIIKKLKLEQNLEERKKIYLKNVHEYSLRNQSDRSNSILFSYNSKNKKNKITDDDFDRLFKNISF